jgi:hypothetical protein
MMFAGVLTARSTTMNRRLIPLKAGAVAFTVLWTAWMTWWSASFSSASVVIPALCGAAIGYLWYRAMRWQFERMGMLPRRKDPTR